MKVLKFYPVWKRNAPKAICDNGVCYRWERGMWRIWASARTSEQIIEEGNHGRPIYIPPNGSNFRLKGLM